MELDQITLYIREHWLEISMVWFPAFVGYFNGFIAASNVMGWTRLAEWCGKVERAITVFIQTARKQNPVIEKDPKNV